MQRSAITLAFILVSALVLNVALLTGVSFSQLAPAAPAATEPKPAVDIYGRTTPRGTVEGYLKAIREADLDKASRFLDVSDQPLPNRKALAKERATQLKQLLDRGGYFYEVSELSNVPEGKSGDELDANKDDVGVLDRTQRKVPIVLERVSGQADVDIWLVSSTTLKRVPFLFQISDEGLVDRLLPESLKEQKFGAVSTGHWIAIVLAALLSLFIGFLISWTLIYLLRKLLERRSELPGRGVLAAIVIPLGVVFGISIYRGLVIGIGIQVVARDNISWIAIIVSWIAIAWLGLRIIDGVAEIVRYSMSRTNRITSIAVVMLARRMAKAVILGIVGISILDILGVDVTTGLAALGIGGLALALGAQKTIENLVGSITVVADKPVRVGDFCQFGDVMGTVEDIGIRSTQIRTLDRTIVTVPNGAFASMQIENYTVRDQFLFRHTLTMRYETTPDQVRYLLKKIRALLADDTRVDDNPARVRFIGLGSHSLDIEVFCYIRAADYNSFLEIQEELLLAIMDIASSVGAEFAFPSQTLYFGKDQKPSPEMAKKISKLVHDETKAAGKS